MKGKAKALLMERSEHSAEEGRWDLAYVYANEAAVQLGGDETSSASQRKDSPQMASAAGEQALRRALYKVMPLRRLLDRVEHLMGKTNECYKKGTCRDEAARLAKRPHVLQLTKITAPLFLLANIHCLLGNRAMTYLYVSEAEALLTLPNESVREMKKHALRGLAGYSRHPLMSFAHDKAENKKAATKGKNVMKAPAYDPSVWPSKVEAVAMHIWDVTPTDAECRCTVELVDWSDLQPPVRFADLPHFFANHTRSNATLSILVLLPFVPLESHISTLFAIHSCRSDKPGGVSPFAELSMLRMDQADLHFISKASFTRLFFVLDCKHLYFRDFLHLPRDVFLMDFLLHPSLVGCPSLEFSQQSIADGKGSGVGAEVLIKFPTSAMLTHLKMQSAIWQQVAAKEGIQGSLCRCSPLPRLTSPRG